MKKIYNKDRLPEFLRQKNLRLCWKISLKYSNILKSYIEKNSEKNINYVLNIHKQFISILKSNNINYTNTKINRIWNDTINTLKNNPNNFNTAIKQLNYVSFKNN